MFGHISFSVYMYRSLCICDNVKQTFGLKYGIYSRGKLNVKKGVEPERDHLFEPNYKGNLQ